MIIETSEFERLPGLTRATLTESSDGPCVLNMDWQGEGPEWLKWMEPVTVRHRGKVLFHGRIISLTHSNNAGEVTASASAQDALWLLDHLTLGAQVAEAQAANEESPADLGAAAQNALQSWTALAESCNVAAPLWVAEEEGEAIEEAQLRLDVSRANFSAAPVYKADKAVTAWTALLTMKNANPDALFRFRPTTGAVEVISIKAADVITWDTERMRLLSCTDIGPQYENSITGVALLVSWSDGDTGGSAVHVYPEWVSEGDMGVKFFSATTESRIQAEEQAAYMMAQIRSYYEAVNVMQWGGSVTALMDDVESSPLCARLNITGRGAHKSWQSMEAIVSSVDWDFLSGTVEVVLGVQFAEPSITEMSFDSGGEGTETKERDDSSTCTNQTTEEPPPPPTQTPSTTTWDGIGGSRTAEESTTTWEVETTTWDYTTTDGETTTSDTWETVSEEESGGTGSATWEDDSTTWSYQGTWETESSTNENECDCAGIWEAQKEFNALMHAFSFSTFWGDTKYIIKDRRCLPDWFTPDMSFQEVFDRVLREV